MPHPIAATPTLLLLLIVLLLSLLSSSYDVPPGQEDEDITTIRSSITAVSDLVPRDSNVIEDPRIYIRGFKTRHKGGEEGDGWRCRICTDAVARWHENFACQGMGVQDGDEDFDPQGSTGTTVGGVRRMALGLCAVFVRRCRACVPCVRARAWGAGAGVRDTA